MSATCFGLGWNSELNRRRQGETLNVSTLNLCIMSGFQVKTAGKTK